MIVYLYKNYFEINSIRFSQIFIFPLICNRHIVTKMKFGYNLLFILFALSKPLEAAKLEEVPSHDKAVSGDDLLVRHHDILVYHLF